MNPQRPTVPDSDDDLRQRLRESLPRSADTDLAALKDRTLHQWRLRGTPQTFHAPGPLAVLQAGWRQHPALWGGALLALGFAALFLLKPWQQPDPALDELLQPDVLYLMSAGEL
jgi:hypothetical protein